MYGSQWFHRYRIDESATDNIRGKSMFFDDVIHRSPENCSTFTAAQSKEMEIFSNLNAMPSVVGGTLDVYKTIEDIKQNMYDTSDFPIQIEVAEYFESERRYLFSPEMEEALICNYNKPWSEIKSLSVMAMKSHGMAFPRIRFQEATMEKPEHTPNEPSFVQVVFKDE